MVTIVVGGHFGDEGKGKIISYLAINDDPDIIARAGVGPNAGHTVHFHGKTYKLRMVPCGFVNEKARLLIGAGVLVNPERFLLEVEKTGTKGRVFLDKRCGIIEKKHMEQDTKDSHLRDKVGTTGSGSGPANAERAHRTLKLAKDFPELKEYLTDVPLEVNRAVDSGKKVLVEASQGFGLSLYYGTYPYVTSKDTTASMAAVDIGIGPKKVEDVLVVYKAYTTRVGEGPLENMITEENIDDFPLWKEIYLEAVKSGIKRKSVNETLAAYLGEKGTVTGRERRIAAFDTKLAKYSAMINSATQAAITCIDKLFPECAKVRDYDKLSKRARDYIEEIESEIKVDIVLISTGQDVNDIIDMRNGR